MATNIDDLRNKVENEGVNEQGRLGANEFNRLVEAVRECQNGVKKVKYGGLDPIAPDDTGLVTIPIISDEWRNSLRIQRLVTRNSEQVYENIEADGTYIYASTDVPIRFQFREYRTRVNDDTGESEYEPSNKEVTIRIYRQSSTGRTKLAQFLYTAKAFASEVWDTMNFASLLSAGANNLIFEVSNTTSGETPSVSFNILAANLSLTVAEDNNWHNTALVVGTADRLQVEYHAAGAIDRTLCIQYTGATGTSKTHRVSVPASSSSSAITVDTFSTAEDTIGFFSEGLKSVKAWIEVGSGDDLVKSNELVNNIIVVQQGSTNKYVAIQSCIDSMLNYEAATMFGYNIYTPDAPATVTFVLANDTKTVTYLETSVPNRAVNTLYEFASVLSIQSSLSNIHVYVYAKINDEWVNGGNKLEDFMVDNSEDFGAVDGAAFYLNPMLRSNQEENPRSIINAVNGNVITDDEANFQNISFQPGVDGWVEENNIRFLRLLAGSTLTIPRSAFDVYQDFSDNSRHGLTIEIDFTVRNITNEEDPIFTIGNRNAANPKGVYMKALEGAFMTGSNASWGAADIRWQEGARTRLVFTFQHNYTLTSAEQGRGRTDLQNNQGYATATISLLRAYINGVINREFRVADVSSAGEINAGGDIVIGQSGCDIDIYGIRVYRKNLSAEDVVKNYISTLPTVAMKKQVHDANDILVNGVVSFEKARAAGYNCIVWHGTNLSRRYKDNPKRYGYAEIYRYKNGVLDEAHSGTLYGIEGTGQGTTAMTYADWNYSFKEDKWDGAKSKHKGDGKSTTPRYWDTDTNTPTADGTKSTGKSVFVDVNGVVAFGSSKQKFGYTLDDDYPVGKKLVGKINYASPMQSHKMGACNMYNDLYARCVTNSITNFSAGQRVAVVEEPFLYFVQEVEGADDALKVFMGLSTFGPGKADKPTWGVDDDTLMDGDSLVEGALNNNPLTDMRVPFVDTIDQTTGRYVNEYQLEDDQGNKMEAFMYAGKKNINWGFGDTMEFHSGEDAVWAGVREGDKTNEDAPTTKQVKLWQPVFNFLYLMNTKIAPWTGPNGDGVDATLRALNIAAAQVGFDTSVAYWMISDGDGYSKFDLYRCHYAISGTGEQQVETKTYVPAGIRLVQGSRVFRNFSTLYDLRAGITEETSDRGVVSYATTDLWYDVMDANTDTRNITLNLRTELSAVIARNSMTDVINYNDDVSIVNTAIRRLICKIFRLYVDNDVYLNKESVQFHHEMMILWAGTDNRSKNTYYRLNPYATVTVNGEERSWPNMEMNDDDLDTIFKTNNSGIQSKPYYALEADRDSGGFFWEGQDNVLNNTLNAAYGYGFLETTDKNLELSNMMGKIYRAMVDLATGKTMPDGSAVSADPVGCFDYYFFYIQKYFPAAAYNETARIRYEIPAVLYRSASENDGGEDYTQDPIGQSLGDQYDSEKEYIRKRVTMLAGYAGYRLSQFGFRGYAGAYRAELKPHQYIYPMYEVGDQRSSSPVRSMRRVAPGETYVMTFTNSSATNGVYFYFIGSMREIGNIATWTTGLGEDQAPSGEAEDTAMAPNAARLIRFDMYSDNAGGVVFNPKSGSFNLAACQNLEHIDVHNAYRLRGLDGLTNLVRLQDIDASGTALSSLGLPSTPTLTSIKLPNTFTTFLVEDCPNLITLQFDGYDSLTSFTVKGKRSSLSTKEILMGIYGYNITQNENVIQTINVENINWTSVNWSFLEWLLTVQNLRLTGRITMAVGTAGQISFALKKRLIEKFGNVDSESNALYIDYTHSNIGSVTVSGDGYFDEVGEVKHYELIPNVVTGNTIQSYQWTLSGASAHMGSVDALGNVSCLAMGTEAAAPTATLTCTVVLNTGETKTASVDIRFYYRQAKPGDFVYHDGSWDDRYNASRDAIGICFMCEPITDEEGHVTGYDRRMVALKNIGSYQWGLYPNGASIGSNGLPSSGADALTYLLDNVATAPFDIPEDILPNITTTGGKVWSNNVDCTTSIVGDDSSYVRFGTMIYPQTGDFYKYSNGVAFGRMALVELGSTLADGVLAGDSVYDGSSMVPRGLRDTAAIIFHRNRVLAGTTYKGADDTLGTNDDVNYGVEFRLDPDIDASTGNVALQINKICTFATDKLSSSYPNIYSQYLYPAASMCYAYEPTISSGNTLNPKFTKHHWYLPAIGELARLYYFAAICNPNDSHYVSQANGNPYPDIFDNAVSMLGSVKFSRLDTSTAYWSSAEYYDGSAWFIYFTNGQTYGNKKCLTFAVRACAAF